MEDAVAGADAIVFALWLDTIKELIPQQARLLNDKVVLLDRPRRSATRSNAP